MEILLQLIILFFSIVLHECAHGWIALLRGDRTAKEEGRLTLNPLPHIDPVGTVLLPLIQWLTLGRILFGYAKPVPVNPFRLKNPRWDMLWVGLAGPATNILLGLGSGFLIRLYLWKVLVLPAVLIQALVLSCMINLWLALVNLIPVPPLDGSRLVSSLLPSRSLPRWMVFEQMGIFVLLLLIGTGFFGKVLGPLLNLLIRGITGL